MNGMYDSQCQENLGRYYMFTLGTIYKAIYKAIGDKNHNLSADVKKGLLLYFGMLVIFLLRQDFETMITM